MPKQFSAVTMLVVLAINTVMLAGAITLIGAILGNAITQRTAALNHVSFVLALAGVINTVVITMLYEWAADEVRAARPRQGAALDWGLSTAVDREADGFVYAAEHAGPWRAVAVLTQPGGWQFEIERTPRWSWRGPYHFQYQLRVCTPVLGTRVIGTYRNEKTLRTAVRAELRRYNALMIESTPDGVQLAALRTEGHTH